MVGGKDLAIQAMPGKCIPTCYSTCLQAADDVASPAQTSAHDRSLGCAGNFVESLNVVGKLLFPAPTPSYDSDSFPGELIWVPRQPKERGRGPRGPKPKGPHRGHGAPEDRVPCLFMPYDSARFVILFLHGNADDLGRCRNFCLSLREQFQVYVMAVEYPGYGICPGGPADERGLTDNALAAFRFLRETLRWPLDSILVFGRSIGCSPALSIAVYFEIGGLILVSPMLSLRAAARSFAGPLGPLVLHERFNNLERMAFLRSPLLIVHGEKDTLIPATHGAELFRACKTRKLLVRPPDMCHNSDLFMDVNYFVVPMLRFFPLPDYCFAEVKVPAWVYHLAESDDMPNPDGSPTDSAGGSEQGEEMIPEDLHNRLSADITIMKPTAPPAAPVVRLPPQRQERTASRGHLQLVITCADSARQLQRGEHAKAFDGSQVTDITDADLVCDL